GKALIAWLESSFDLDGQKFLDKFRNCKGPDAQRLLDSFQEIYKGEFQGEVVCIKEIKQANDVAKGLSYLHENNFTFRRLISVGA
ncbi:hypothetical protein C0993_002061, partial [Termitomyces sp. T159_Od127]